MLANIDEATICREKKNKREACKVGIVAVLADREGVAYSDNWLRRCLLYYPCSLDMKNPNVVFLVVKENLGNWFSRLIEPWYQGRQSFKAQMEAAGVERILDLQNFLT